MPYFEVQLTRKLQKIYDIAPDTVIGRAPQCHIQLLSRAVSRRHARIELGDQGEVIVSDMGTKNGIKLNGLRIQGAAQIREGDELVVGDVSMKFRAVDRVASDADAIDLRRRAPQHDDARVALTRRVTFLLPADQGALATFQNTIVRARIAALDFDDTTRFKLQIALKEALDNAREHGSGNDPSRTIRVSLGEEPDEFVMSVADEGPGYDFEGVVAGASELDAFETIRSRHQLGRGLGLRILLNCVDRLQLEGRGSTIHMGRFKEGGQIFVISDDSDVGQAGDPGASPFADTHADEDGGGGDDETGLLGGPFGP